VFLPIGCATYDYWGGDRAGANLFGDSLVALDAATGKLKWYFQTTHHDIWDRDLQAPPLLLDVSRNGKKIPAVAQMTKQSFLFILDRVTGTPLYPVEERPVPQDGAAPGDRLWPTQPFPSKPGPLARIGFSFDEIAKVTPEHEKFCAELLKTDGGLRPGGPFVPFHEKATIMFPATLGGGNWHGGSFDPQLGYVFVNTSNLGEVFISTMDEGVGRPITRRRLFWNEEKLWPCQQPPWGELSAVNVNTGEIAWRVPLGSFKELEAKGIANSGTPSLGGSIATAGGLVFVAGTIDDRFRAYDSRTGKELWIADLGAAAHTVPISYLGRDGKQYVAVMVSGGGFLRDHGVPANLQVFALP
jgi:quinoprotein glucose dehydrogenase